MTPHRILTTAATSALTALLALTGAACTEGSGSSAVAVPDVDYPIAMTEYDFVSPVTPAFRTGDTVRFMAQNVGVVPHEIQVLDADATLLGETGDVAAGASTELVVTFGEPGIYQLICDVDDHLSRGQRVAFEVSDGS